MRAFIALPLPDSVKEELGKIQTACQDLRLDAKWVKPDNMHMTFKFLGDVELERIDDVEQALRATVTRFDAFDCTASGFGFFPSPLNPRVFFVTTDCRERLACIADILEDELDRFGFKKEGRFQSHITLCRFRSKKNAADLQAIIDSYAFHLQMPVRRLVLYKSTLTPQGPLYQELNAFPLRHNK